jgi:hypothetical protein
MACPRIAITAGVIVSLAAILSAGSPGIRSPGIRPRAAAADYPAHDAANTFAIGAATIPRNQVGKIFAADLNKAGYIVIEVGVFPSQGAEVDLSPGDFTLFTEAGRVATRSVDADTVALSLARKHETPLPGGGGVYSSTGVGVARISTVDLATGRPSHTTVVSTDQEVGVDNSPPRYPSASGPDVAAVEQELWTKSLPDGKTSAPVAGYLYFPKPSARANAGASDLMMDGPAGRVKLTLPNSGGH